MVSIRRYSFQQIYFFQQILVETVKACLKTNKTAHVSALPTDNLSIMYR